MANYKRGSYKYGQSFVDHVHSMKNMGYTLKDLEKELNLTNSQIRHILYRLTPSSNEASVETSSLNDKRFWLERQRERLVCTNELVYPKTLRQRIRSFFGWFFS